MSIFDCVIMNLLSVTLATGQCILITGYHTGVVVVVGGAEGAWVTTRCQFGLTMISLKSSVSKYGSSDLTRTAT